MITLQLSEDGVTCVAGGQYEDSKNRSTVVFEVRGETDAEKLHCIAQNIGQIADCLIRGAHDMAIAAMMADGQVEGQWGSPTVIKEISDEEFRRMVKGATADGTVNAAMHEEFEARGLDTAQIPVVDPTADARALHEYWRSRDDLIMPPPVQDAGPLESTAMAGCDTGRNSFGVMAEIEGFEKSSDHEK